MCVVAMHKKPLYIYDKQIYKKLQNLQTTYMYELDKCAHLWSERNQLLCDLQKGIWSCTALQIKCCNFYAVKLWWILYDSINFPNIKHGWGLAQKFLFKCFKRAPLSCKAYTYTLNVNTSLKNTLFEKDGRLWFSVIFL